MTVSSLPIRLGFETERTLAAASVGASYIQVGSSFANPIRILVLQNQTNAAVTFSLDGTNNTITLQASTFITLDLTANASISLGFFAPVNMSVWVKQSGTPTTGSVFVSAFYATGPN